MDIFLKFVLWWILIPFFIVFVIVFVLGLISMVFNDELFGRFQTLFYILYFLSTGFISILIILVWVSLFHTFLSENVSALNSLCSDCVDLIGGLLIVVWFSVVLERFEIFPELRYLFEALVLLFIMFLFVFVILIIFVCLYKLLMLF
jgi:hypothetical protein